MNSLEDRNTGTIRNSDIILKVNMANMFAKSLRANMEHSYYPTGVMLATLAMLMLFFPVTFNKMLHHFQYQNMLLNTCIHVKMV